MLLDVQEVTKRFGGLVAVDRMTPDGARRRDRGADRPERRGQEHRVQRDLGRARRNTGEMQFRGARCQPARSRDIAKLGLSRTFQHVRLLPQMSVLDNVAIGAHRREYPGLLVGVIAGAWRLDRRGRSEPAG